MRITTETWGYTIKMYGEITELNPKGRGMCATWCPTLGLAIKEVLEMEKLGTHRKIIFVKRKYKDRMS